METTMKKEILRTGSFLVVVTLATTLAFAQAQGNGIARLKGVKGNVLLSHDAGLAAGGEATRLPEHTRVITTAGAEVVVVYDNGCEVRLKENQRFEVETDKPCAALLAQSILGQPPVPVAAAGGFGPLLPAMGGIAIGIYLLRDGRSTALSPS
jgi:hypothetical protein